LAPAAPARPVHDPDERLRGADLFPDVDAVLVHGPQDTAVAARSSPTSRRTASMSRPSVPRASTRAEATITPSAPALAMAGTWAGLLVRDTPPTRTATPAC